MFFAFCVVVIPQVASSSGYQMKVKKVFARRQRPLRCTASPVPKRCAVALHAVTCLSVLSMRRAAIERFTTLKRVLRAHSDGHWSSLFAISSMRVLSIRGIGMLMATMPGARA